MSEEYSQFSIKKADKKYMDEQEVRELIAASLANWTGITRFRTIESTITTIADFTSSQHTHANAAGGGQLVPANAFSAAVPVSLGGTGVTSLTNNAVVIGQGSGAVSTIVGLAGTKVYYVSDTSGGAVTRKLTYQDGILISET